MLLARRGITSYLRSGSNNSMNLKYAAFAGALAQSSSAWMHRPIPGAVCRIRSETADLSFRSMSTFTLQSAATTEEADTAAPLLPGGKPIAEGSVVSAFRGGLVAVRIEDEIMEEVDDTPDIVDTTNSLPKNAKSSSLGKERLFFFSLAPLVFLSWLLSFTHFQSF